MSKKLKSAERELAISRVELTETKGIAKATDNHLEIRHPFAPRASSAFT